MKIEYIQKGIGPVPSTARTTHGTCTSSVVARTSAASTTLAGFGR